MILGVLDWGVGGLFALGRAMALEPSLDAVYLSDAGNTPYGKQSRAELQRSVGRALDRLEALGATHRLIACHSASSVLPLPGRHAVGVIDPRSVPADGSVLVLGGARTIRSQRWRRALGGRDVVQRIAQPLSGHVEAGTEGSPACLDALDRILAGVDPDVIVLACTHYAALRPAIASRRPRARIIDPIDAVVDGLPLDPGGGHLGFYTTGIPEVANRRAGSLRWGGPSAVRFTAATA